MNELIPIYKPWLTEIEKKHLSLAIDSEWISSKGKYLNLFQEKLSEFINCKYSSLLNTGTAACHLALLCSGINEGDEVIVPACTFIAAVNSIKYCNAIPVLADIDNENWNISFEEIKKKTTSKTKAVFLVHLLGNPCPSEIYEWCKSKNIICIEDACESIGASLNGNKTGTLGSCGAFSFFGNKNITTGEGGAITTNDENIFKQVEYLKGQAQDRTYIHSAIGYNYRMTNIQAALGYAQILRVKEITDEKNRVFSYYKNSLKDLILSNKIKIQKETKGSAPANWMFAIKSDKKNEIEKTLNQNNIETRPLFYPVNEMLPYKSDIKYVNSIDLNRNAIMLPSYPELSKNQIDKICDLVKKVIEQ